MSTIDSIETRVRYTLQETTASEWTQAQIFQYVNEAHRRAATILGRVPNSGFFENFETVSVSSNTETYDLSGLTYLFAAIKRVWYVPSNGTKPIELFPYQPGTEDDYRDGSATTRSGDFPPSGYFLRRTAGTDYLHFLPLSSDTARSFRIYYRLTPAILTTGQSLHTPAAYDDWIAMMAARLALRDEGMSDDRLDADIEERQQEVIEDAARADGEDVSLLVKTVVSDDQWA